MPLRSCEYMLCSRAAERTRGSCMICSKHHCEEHSGLPFHDCPDEDRDEDAYYDACAVARKSQVLAKLRKVDTARLSRLASDLRGGVPCRIPALDGVDVDFELASSQMGGMNCNVDVNFEDGVTWLARIRLTYPSHPPDSVQDAIFLSEVATLRFLESTRVPSPRVYHYEMSGSTNPVGVSFLLMEKLHGTALQWHEATAAQKTKVTQQLVTFLLELEKHPFASSGSLQLAEEGSITVGPIAQTLFFQTPDQSLGPFDNFDSSLKAKARAQIQLICGGELALFAVDNYLTQRWRLSQVARVAAPPGGGCFYLKHAEDKGDHILVDADYNITGIIDWEFATTEPADLALSSPCMTWPVGDFYDGRNNLTAEEEEFATMFEQHGRADLANIVREGRKIQRFTFINGGSVAADRADFEGLFQGLRAAMADDEGKLDTYGEWRKRALETYKADEQLQRLLQRESSRLD